MPRGNARRRARVDGHGEPGRLLLGSADAGRGLGTATSARAILTDAAVRTLSHEGPEWSPPTNGHQRHYRRQMAFAPKDVLAERLRPSWSPSGPRGLLGLGFGPNSP